MNYADFYRRSIEQPDAFWAEQARLIHWQRPFDAVCDYSRPPFAKWFVGGQTNLCHNAIDRHLVDRPDQNALIWVSTEVDQERVLSFRRAARRGAAHGRDDARAGREAGRPRADLHADDCRGRVCHAGLCTHRRDPFGGLRRFCQRQPGQRIDNATPVLIVSADAGSRSGKVMAYKPLLDEAIRLAVHKPAKVLMVDRGLAPFDPRAWPRRGLCGVAREAPRCAGAVCMAGRHPPQLHAVHQRHHRHAQRCAARHRRLRGGAGGEHETHLPVPAWRDLLFHQRHRLGGGPQLHRLWAADRRHGDDPVRRPAGSPRCGRVVAPCREVQGDGHVQRADRGARVEEARPGLAGQVRPVQPARAVPGRRTTGRADGPLDLAVARSPDHRQLLADRKRLADPDHRQRRRNRHPASSVHLVCRCTASRSS